MNNQLDDKVWRATRKAGLKAEKVKGFASLHSGQSLFRLYEETMGGWVRVVSHGRDEWTASEVLESLNDSGRCDLDVACVSMYA